MESLNMLKILTISSFVFAFLGMISLIIYENAGNIFCGDKLFTSEYSTCKDIFQNKIIIYSYILFIISGFLIISAFLKLKIYEEFRSKIRIISYIFLPLISIVGVAGLIEYMEPQKSSGFGLGYINWGAGFFIILLIAYVWLLLSVVWSSIYNHRPNWKTVIISAIAIVLVCVAGSEFSSWSSSHDSDIRKTVYDNRNLELCGKMWNEVEVKRCIQEVIRMNRKEDDCYSYKDEDIRKSCYGKIFGDSDPCVHLALNEEYQCYSGYFKEVRVRPN